LLAKMFITLSIFSNTPALSDAYNAPTNHGSEVLHQATPRVRESVVPPKRQQQFNVDDKR